MCRLLCKAHSPLGVCAVVVELDHFGKKKFKEERKRMNFVVMLFA